MDDHPVHVRVMSNPVADALAEMPTAVANLLREHVADAHGLCRACTRPGTGTAYLVWPCPLRRVAEAAQKIRAARPTVR